MELQSQIFQRQTRPATATGQIPLKLPTGHWQARFSTLTGASGVTPEPATGAIAGMVLLSW